MPDTYANPYRYTSPIGEAFANLTRAITGGPSDASRIKAAEEALALKRKREGITSLGELFAQYGQPGFDRNGAMQSAIYGDYDPQNLAQMERYGAANTYGALDPRTDNAVVGAGGAYSSTGGGFTKSLQETIRNNDQQSLDRRYGVDVGAATTRRGDDQESVDRRYGVDVGAETSRFNNAANNTREREEFFATPKPALDAQGNPVFLPQGGLTAPGVSPVLTDTERKGTLVNKNWSNLGTLDQEQKKYLGADVAGGSRPTPRNMVSRSTGKNYISYDGITDARDGSPLPNDVYVAGVNAGSASDAGLGLTTAARTGLQNDQIANDTLRGMIGAARDAVNQSPDVNFGVTGNIKTLAQNAAIIATNLAQGLGFNAPADALSGFQKEMQNSGVDPSIISGIFDPRLGELQAIYGTLVYATARALSGGGTLSNQDVQAARDSIGDPGGLMANKQTLLSKLNAIEKLLDVKQGITDKTLNPARPGATGVPGPQTLVPPAAVPGRQGNAQTADPNKLVQMASSMLGMNEVAQRANIQEYLKSGGVNLDPATTAWCAAFINSTLAQNGVQGTGSNMARSFLNFGTPTNEPQRGDIVVFWRNDPKGSEGHVAFFDSMNSDGTIRVLGGNQGNSVSYDNYPTSRVLGYRRVGAGSPTGPAGVSAPASGSPAVGGAPTAPISAAPPPFAAPIDSTPQMRGPGDSGFARSPVAPLPAQNAPAPADGVVLTPDGGQVPKSFIEANGGDADLWNYMSEQAKARWKEVHGD